MKLNDYKNEEWSIEHYDGCPAFTEMTGSGFSRKLSNSKLPVYKFCVSYYREGEGDWITLVSDQKEIGKKIVAEFMKNQEIVTGLYNKWIIEFNLLLKFFNKNYQQNLTKLTSKELIKWADELCEFYREEISMPGFLDGYMLYADKHFNLIVKEFCDQHKIKNYPKIFSTLSSPIDHSFLNEAEMDLIKITKQLRKLKYKSKIDLKKFLLKRDPKLLKQFENYLFKYSWIKSNYYGYRKYSWHDLQVEVEKIVKENKTIGNNIFQDHKKEKIKLISKYKFTPEILAIARLTEIFIKWQDQRKIYTLTFVTLQSRLLQEISQRTGIEFEILKYSQTKEIAGIISRNFNKNKLLQRKQGCLFIYKKGEVSRIIIGNPAKKFIKDARRINLGKIEEIQGMSASLGCARGKVKIIMTAKNINKVKKGDILVAPMTRPEHLAGMKKAAAIVTDDGGITCHAAIIARELKIPCIIGTKIATKVLKDGDLVEVDANKGIVKIIK